MPYNPGSVDVSGQLLGDGIAGLGAGIAQGMERQKKEQDILKEASGRGKALSNAFKSLEELNILPAGLSDRLKQAQENMSPREFLGYAAQTSQELGTLVQGGFHMQQLRAQEEAAKAKERERVRLQQAMSSVMAPTSAAQDAIAGGARFENLPTGQQAYAPQAPSLQQQVGRIMSADIDPSTKAQMITAVTGAHKAMQPPKDPNVPAAIQEIEARIQADLAAGNIVPQDVNKKRAEYYAEAAKKAPATSINLGNNMKQEAFKSLLSEKQTNIMPLLGAQPTLDSMEAMLNALDDKGQVITGALANLELGAKSLLNSTGLTNFEDVAATQAYLGQAVRLTGQIIKDFGAGTALSDADREYAAMAAAGKITMDKPALKKLAGMAKRVMKTRIDNYNRSVSDSFDPNDEEGKYALRALTIKAMPSAAEQAKSVFEEADAIIGRK